MSERDAGESSVCGIDEKTTLRRRSAPRKTQNPLITKARESEWNVRPMLRALWYWVNCRLRETNDTEIFPAIMGPWEFDGESGGILEVLVL